MASPQKENGYTAVANEILEQIAMLQLNGTQFRIIMTVWRYTYGFSRKSHSLSETFLAKATKIHKMQIARELRVLINKRILSVIRDATFSTSKEIAFNKNYDEWIGVQLADTIPVSELAYSKLISSETVSGLVYSTVSESAHQERNNKNNIKKDVQEFFESVWKLYPEKKGKGKVSEKSKKALYELGFDTVKACIDRYTKNKPDWQHFQNGSTFFNSGYIDYLDKNYLSGGSEVAEKFKDISDKPEDWSGF